MDNSKKNGFTLIETLIVTAIIIFLSGTSLAIISTYKDDTALNNQVTVLTSVLELAKNKASAGDVSLCSDSTSAHVKGYTVTVSVVSDPDPSTITLTPECTTSPIPQINTIPKNIIYTPLSATFRFDNQNYQGPTTQLIIKNTETVKCKFIKIADTGLITSGSITCP